MLKQRVITGLLMALAFVLAVAFLPLQVLALLFAVLIALGGWEWSRMAGWQSPIGRFLYVLLLLVSLAALYWSTGLTDDPAREQVQPFLGLACFWWAFALLWVRSYPGSAVLWRNRFMRSLMGFLILVPAWFAAIYVLGLPRGEVLLMVMVLTVVVADVGAYFSGKQFGRHKLAEHVSPAKTWEGFWGGVLSTTLLGLLFWYLLPERFDHVGMASVLAVVLSTSLASVLGDLAVSMVKRESGIKDSGSLLPGHGGILDRLDSISGAAPVFALGLLLAGWW